MTSRSSGRGFPVYQPQTQLFARWSEDGLWYKARVTDLLPESQSYLVVFVDYGNTQVCTLADLAPLDTTVMKVAPPPLADAQDAAAIEAQRLARIEERRAALKAEEEQRKKDLEEKRRLQQEKKAKLEALEREEKQRQLDEQRARLEAKSPRGAPGDIAPLQPPLKFNTNSAPGTTTFGVAPAVAASAAVSAANTTPASSPLKPASMSTPAREDPESERKRLEKRMTLSVVGGSGGKLGMMKGVTVRELKEVASQSAKAEKKNPLDLTVAEAKATRVLDFGAGDTPTKQMVVGELSGNTVVSPGNTIMSPGSTMSPSTEASATATTLKQDAVAAVAAVAATSPQSANGHSDGKKPKTSVFSEDEEEEESDDNNNNGDEKDATPVRAVPATLRQGSAMQKALAMEALEKRKQLQQVPEKQQKSPEPAVVTVEPLTPADSPAKPSPGPAVNAATAAAAPAAQVVAIPTVVSARPNAAVNVTQLAVASPVAAVAASAPTVAPPASAAPSIASVPESANDSFVARSLLKELSDAAGTQAATPTASQVANERDDEDSLDEDLAELQRLKAEANQMDTTINLFKQLQQETFKLETAASTFQSDLGDLEAEARALLGE